jgi:hypothetical protein
MLTCVTQTTVHVSVPNGGPPTSTVFEGGLTGSMTCTHPGDTEVHFFGSAVAAVTSTTTTATHGMNSRVISSNSTPTSATVVAGGSECAAADADDPDHDFDDGT